MSIKELWISSKKLHPQTELEWLHTFPQRYYLNKQLLVYRINKTIPTYDPFPDANILARTKMGRDILKELIHSYQEQIDDLFQGLQKDHQNACFYQYNMDELNKRVDSITYLLAAFTTRKKEHRSWEEKKALALSHPIEKIYEAQGCGKLRGASHEKIGKCPFHEDNLASFSINTEKNVYMCFAGCLSGNSITFVKQLFNVDFRKAVDILTK